MSLAAAGTVPAPPPRSPIRRRADGCSFARCHGSPRTTPGAWSSITAIRYASSLPFLRLRQAISGTIDRNGCGEKQCFGRLSARSRGLVSRYGFLSVGKLVGGLRPQSVVPAQWPECRLTPEAAIRMFDHCRVAGLPQSAAWISGGGAPMADDTTQRSRGRRQRRKARLCGRVFLGFHLSAAKILLHLARGLRRAAGAF